MNKMRNAFSATLLKAISLLRCVHLPSCCVVKTNGVFPFCIQVDFNAVLYRASAVCAMQA